MNRTVTDENENSDKITDYKEEKQTGRIKYSNSCTSKDDLKMSSVPAKNDIASWETTRMV